MSGKKRSIETKLWMKQWVMSYKLWVVSCELSIKFKLIKIKPKTKILNLFLNQSTHQFSYKHKLKKNSIKKMRPRTNSRSRDLLSDQPITIIELQQLLKGVEDRIQLKNDLILANINKLEKQLNYLQNKQNNLSSNTPTNLYLPPILSFCGLTQEQLDLYKWVDVNSGRCLAKYCNSEGNELTCNQLYTSHERYQSFYSSLQSTNNINTTMNNNSNNTTSLDLPIPPIPQTSNSSTSTISTTSTSISSNNNDTNTVESKSLNKKSSSISKSSNTISNEVNPDIKREAAARIQRLASRRRAWKTAEAEREWKVNMFIIYFSLFSIYFSFFYFNYLIVK